MIVLFLSPFLPALCSFPFMLLKKASPKEKNTHYEYTELIYQLVDLFPQEGTDFS